MRGIAPSYCVVPEGELVRLAKLYAGHGEPELRNDGSWNGKEVVVTDRIIGYVVLEDGREIPTRSFKIHYSDRRVHCVPRFDEGGEPDDYMG